MKSMNVQEIINRSLEKKEKRQRSGKMSPSLFGRCYRLQYWDRLDVEQSNPPDERLLRVFACGTRFHDWVQGLIIKEYPEAKVEVEITTEDVHGFADMVMDDTVTELKSQHSNAFHHLRKIDKTIAEKQPTHVLQVTAYAYLLNKDFAQLVYISKDDLCILQFRITMTAEAAQKVCDEIRINREFFLGGKTPPPLPRTKWDCDRCNYRDHCKEVESGNS